MLYLIPDWHEDTKLADDRIYTLSKFFSKAGCDNKIVLTNALPFLRYQLNENGYSYNSVMRVFDSLQNIQTSVGHPVSLEDIVIAPEVDKVYTPNGTMLVVEDQVVATVFYNKYGFISRLRRFQNNDEVIDDIYDDRGFVSAREYLDANYRLTRIEYFNELGELTLTQIGERLTIEKAGNPLLENRSYSSRDEAVKDVLSYLMNEELASHPDNQLSIITTTEQKIIRQTQGIPYNGKMIRIITDDNSVGDLREDELIIDSKSKVTSKLDAATYIPIFLPRLNLGISDSVPVMQLYLKLSTIRPKEERMLSTLIERVIKDEKLSLVCEVDDFQSLDRAKFLQKIMIDEYFEVDSDASDYQKVKKYIISKNEKRLFTQDADAIKEIRKSDDWQNYVGAVNANLRISYLSHPDRLTLEATFKAARIYLDFEDHYHMLRHAKAVSHGIPIISQHRSDYVIEGKNGFILKPGHGEFNESLDYFIDYLPNWNQSLICSVAIITEHEPDTIMKKWEEVIDYGS